MTFQPKGEDEIKQEVTNNYGIDESNNKEAFDKIVADRLKDEEVKANLHKQKHKNKQARQRYEEKLKEAGLSPEEDQSSNEGGSQDSPENSGQNQQQGDRYVTKEELTEMQERQRFNHLSDEEYEMVKNEADRTGKSKEKVIQENPVLKTYFENVDLEQRLKSSTAPPSGKVSPQKSEKLTDRQKEIARKFGNDPEQVYGTNK